MTRIRGVTPKKYVCMDYCSTCGLWGEKQLCVTYLSNNYFITSFLHTEFIAGYRFRTRCYCLNEDK